MEKSDYNFLDKCLYKLAFDVPWFVNILKDLEDDVFSKQLENTKIQRPVFVSGLPRSGTTFLLSTLYSTQEFTTFTYRHMPFITIPIFWEKLSKLFRSKNQLKERAHGDGMQVSFDSPEAFEEIIWLQLLNEKILADNVINIISPQDLTVKVINELQKNIKKLLFLNKKCSYMPRYLSKNNMNISRLPCLLEVFPDATIIVPFREPKSHIASLRHQHQRFLSMNQKDRFTRDYMRWTGHRDFGLNFKPIAFQGKEYQDLDTNNIQDEFWANYWAECYEHLLNNKLGGVHFLDYDKLLISPIETLNKISEICDISQENNLKKYAQQVRPPTTIINSLNLTESTERRVFNIYQKLQSKAL